MNGGHDVIVGLGLIPPTSSIVLLSTELCARNGSKSNTFPDEPTNVWNVKVRTQTSLTGINQWPSAVIQLCWKKNKDWQELQ